MNKITPEKMMRRINTINGIATVVGTAVAISAAADAINNKDRKSHVVFSGLMAAAAAGCVVASNIATATTSVDIMKHAKNVAAATAAIDSRALTIDSIIWNTKEIDPDLIKAIPVFVQENYKDYINSWTELSEKGYAPVPVYKDGKIEIVIKSIDSLKKEDTAK